MRLSGRSALDFLANKIPIDDTYSILNNMYSRIVEPVFKALRDYECLDRAGLRCCDNVVADVDLCIYVAA